MRTSVITRSALNRVRFILSALVLLVSACATRALRPVAATPHPVQTPAFRKELAAVAMTPWTSGNSVRTLENGDGFFPPMLQAAASARRSITFECYTAASCREVVLFSRVLAARAKAGVKVHVILDAIGCRQWGVRLIREMRRAGVEVKFYGKFHLQDPLAYNCRTHRRGLVVDGRTGYCGGAGFAVNWTGNAQDREHWRDTQYELRGPVVAQLQDNFNEHWRELTGAALRGSDYYPRLAKAGTLTAQMAAGSPQGQAGMIGGTFLLAIRAAHESILIEQSYFLPPPEITDALVAAAARGVRVWIILPGKITDWPIIKDVTLRTMRKLINAGGEIYEFEPTMMHGKLLTVDDHLVIAGSANLDPRSLFINAENNLHVLDSEFAREQRRMFERDLAQCVLLTGDGLRTSLPRRLRGFLMQIFSGML